MDTKDKEEIGQVVAETLQDVLMPSLEDMHNDIKQLKQAVSGLKQDVHILKQDVHVLKQDVHVLKQDLGEVKITVERLDRKSDFHEDKVFKHGKRLDDHETRITALEST